MNQLKFEILSKKIKNLKKELPKNLININGKFHGQFLFSLNLKLNIDSTNRIFQIKLTLAPI